MKQKIPKHVAIIMDGNGRWAQDQGLPRTDGHRSGVKAIKPILKVCAEKKIQVLSIWAFSKDNWLRPESEVEFLLHLFMQSIEDEINELHSNGIRLCFTGDKSKFPKELQDAMQKSEQLTIENKSALLNVVVNYTGRWDILQASKSIARDIVENSLSIDDVSEQLFASRLSTNALPDPDLLIRTSGEERISNFFLWQIAYSELYFTQIAWPDFTVEEFEKALIDFESRERRFGKISTQLTEGQNV